mmetsp:Transcript_965/g.1423  ORF Transcript_965/g.1423 Transcript_965/m.1423 type:complete len:260 (-) Transcript_965:496-1275(-)|eukprot:CAMPEP_0184504392 /NCGR_PEP_ID=MMETSP0113_2-20130426/52345_1 /TAXON_ID=91329 /ORGANISM="Norrisiella sphaerica, Strain BC52" /LENGTH=259 /DNA_ID=CAMNT_0026894035 /DNA_START=428 /DNA_END=1207 /DNA_ORIENTATION=-
MVLSYNHVQNIPNGEITETLNALWDNLYLLVPIYAVAVPYLQKVFDPKNKRKEEIYGLKSVMLAYNILMSLFSLVCFIGISWVILVNQKGQVRVEDCQQYDRDPLFRGLVKAFHWSKYVEFIDTFFLIINYKPVSWLHYFHHCGAALNVGILEHSGIEAAWMFLILNAFVHTIMYGYYAGCILGFRFKAKALITTMQIIQFLTGFTFFWSYKELPCFRKSGPLMAVYCYTYSYVGVVLLFFLNFFINSYCTASRKAKKA